VVDVLAVPQRLEQPVGEAQHEQVLDHLLPQVVVHAEDARLVEVAMQPRVQCPGAGEICAEGLLDDDAHPASRPGTGQARGAQVVHHSPEEGRSHGEIEEAVAPGASLAIQLAQALSQARVVLLPGEIHGHVVEPLSEDLPCHGIQLLHGLLEALSHAGAEGLAVHPRERGSHQGEALGQQAPLEEPEQGRQQLAPGKIARGAKENEDAGLGDGLGRGSDRSPFVPSRGCCLNHGSTVEVVCFGGFLVGNL
jgi:hypothetical protein